VAGTDELWGGILTSVSLDPSTWTVSCGVDVVDRGSVRRYQLVLEEVAGLSAERDVPLPWNYAELTAVHVSDVPGGTKVEIILWAEPTGMTVRCSRVRVVPPS
jgi:hypothetical protein